MTQHILLTLQLYSTSTLQIWALQGVGVAEDPESLSFGGMRKDDGTGTKSSKVHLGEKSQDTGVF